MKVSRTPRIRTVWPTSSIRSGTHPPSESNVATSGGHAFDGEPWQSTYSTSWEAMPSHLLDSSLSDPHPKKACQIPLIFCFCAQERDVDLGECFEDSLIGVSYSDQRTARKQL